MVFRYKIVASIFLLLIIASCDKKVDCQQLSKDKHIVIPYPPPYQDYFSQLPNTTVLWKSNNGLSNSSYVKSDTKFFYLFDQYSIDPISCSRLSGLYRYVTYSQTFYKQYFETKIVLTDNYRLNLFIRIEYWDTVNTDSHMWNMLKVLNDNSFSCKTFINDNPYFQENGVTVNCLDSDYSILDSIQVNNRIFRNVFHIINRQGMLDGTQFTITEMYIDNLIGVVKYKLKNGQIWDAIF